MRIQHNILAMNAYRNYNTNTSALSKNLEKLSSGYKINRAGDDAAGLAISEKMRAQITGLNAAQKNVKDGISLVKTAEGAMQEIQDMLNRMDYLATQSANGTYDNEVDRANLQKEVDALKTEINRIADSANFNGIKLLDGSQDGTAPSAGSVELDTFQGINGFTPIADGTNAKTPAKGKYELDLSRASFTASTKTASVSVTIAGGTKITVNATATGQVITGADIAKKYMDSLTNNEVTIDGKKFKVVHDGNGKLTFNGVDNAEMKGKQKLMVTIQGTSIKQSSIQSTSTTPQNPLTGTNIAITSGNQAWSQAFTMLQEPVDAANTLAAQAKFTLTTNHVKDGMTLKIGDETYTFAVGKDSKFKDKANIIDLTDYEESEDDRVKVAAMRLTGVANGNKSVFVEANNTDGTIYLTEKLGGMDRDKWDMIGEKSKQQVDATWATHEDSTAFVQIGLANPDEIPDKNGSAVTKDGLKLQIGDTADDFNQLSVVIGNMHADALKINTIDISSQDTAREAINAIKDAINYVSSVRGDLGATQNRLEHTANNLSVMAENIQDAESTIRDTDVAEEMMAYTKNNILIQSAQAMLAQANAIPQGVLQLLG